ncbi:MAG: hypothetical protein R3Y09_10965 [Clostridia bacterium]
MAIKNYLLRLLTKNQNVTVSQTKNLQKSNKILNSAHKTIQNPSNIHQNTKINDASSSLATLNTLNSTSDISHYHSYNDSINSKIYNSTVHNYANAQDIYNYDFSKSDNQKSDFGYSKILPSESNIITYRASDVVNIGKTAKTHSNFAKTSSNDIDFNEIYRFILQELKKEMKN